MYTRRSLIISQVHSLSSTPNKNSTLDAHRVQRNRRVGPLPRPRLGLFLRRGCPLRRQRRRRFTYRSSSSSVSHSVNIPSSSSSSSSSSKSLLSTHHACRLAVSRTSKDLRHVDGVIHRSTRHAHASNVCQHRRRARRNHRRRLLSPVARSSSSVARPIDHEGLDTHPCDARG